MIKYTNTKIAQDLGISQSAVSQWFSGLSKPTIDKVFKMEELHDIPVTAWKDIKSFIDTSITPTKTT